MYTISHRPEDAIEFLGQFEIEAGVPQLLRPMFDIVWQACGYPGSCNYDNEGKLITRH
jgi:hypothetical protein